MASSESPIFPAPSDDPEMQQASSKARQTFRFFWRELAWERRRIIPGLELAAVKECFRILPRCELKTPKASKPNRCGSLMWTSMDGEFPVH